MVKVLPGWLAFEVERKLVVHYSSVCWQASMLPVLLATTLIKVP